MSDPHSLFKPFRPHSRHTSHHFDLLVVSLLRTFEDHLWIVDLPPPRCRYRIRTMSPAKNTLVTARKRRRGLHTEMRFYTVEGVLVARPSTTERRFCPAADLDTRM